MNSYVRRAEAMEQCARLFDSVATRLLESPDLDVSYATGRAGACVALAEFALLLPDTAAHAHPAVPANYEKLISAVAEIELTPGLFQGLCGVLWAIDCLPSLDARLEPVDMIDVCHDLSNLVARYPADGEYELTLGILGIGRFAQLAGIGNGMANTVVEAVNWLVVTAQRDPTGTYWRTSFDGRMPGGSGHFRPGEINLGLAHGNFGVLAWLADLNGTAASFPKEIRADLEGKVRSLLDSTAAWLVNAQSPGGPHAYGPTASSMDKFAGLGWCYGDLSAACVLGCAARSLGDDRLLAASLDLAIRSSIACANIDDKDMSLCHGAPSRLYLLQRAYTLFGDARLARSADMQAYRLLDQIRAGEKLPDEPGLLTGQAGVLCSLANWLEPNRSPLWKQLLLV